MIVLRWRRSRKGKVSLMALSWSAEVIFHRAVVAGWNKVWHGSLSLSLSLSHFAPPPVNPSLVKNCTSKTHTSIHTQKQWQQCCCSHKLENYPRTEQTLFGSKLGNCPPDHWFLLCQDFSPGNGSLKFKTLCFPNQHFHFQTCFLSLSLSLCAAVLTDLTTLIDSLTHSLTHCCDIDKKNTLGWIETHCLESGLNIIWKIKPSIPK
jgi:hypothetical protein